MALQDKIVAYWKLDESSGNAADSTGHGYTLTNNGTTPYAAAKINNGGDFNGSTQSMNNNSVLAATSYPRSFYGWFNPDTLAADMSVFSLSDGSVHYYTLKIRNSDNHIVFRSNNSTNAGDVDTGATAATGTWYQYVVVQNSSTSVDIYINGSSTNTAAATFAATVSQYYIGYLGRSSVWFFDGKIDETGISGRALTSGDATQLYNGNSGLSYPFGIPLGNLLQDYYKFDTSSVDTVGFADGADTSMTYGTPGIVGNGAQFNGTTGTFSVPIVFGPVGTVNLWFKRADTTTQQGAMFGSTKIGVSDFLRISPLSSVSNTVQWIVQDDVTNSSWTCDTNWHMATLCWDASTAWTGYLDGVLVTTGTGVKNPTNTGYNLRWGVNADGTGIFPSVYYKGSGDELGYWTTRLNQTQVTQLYNKGLANQWPFIIPSTGTGFFLAAAQ